MTKSVFILCLMFVISCKNTEPPKPLSTIPSERQMKWHEMEFYAFVHFNMNTFSNMEWGLGSESPQLFNPTELDCRQWARVCKEAGLKGIIITAKHHDGFCLWPSVYTEHSVKNSPWKNGQGDVVKELAEACKEYGLKLGIYISPWDRNHADYGKPEYLEYFKNQLRELLTNYGEIYEVWFDGANGGTGWYGGANENRKIDNRTYYEWETIHKIVRELQPNACMFSDAGPDIRWVGNEEGWARETNWCMLNRDSVMPGNVPEIEWLRSGQENGSHWVPAEVDVSIRPGWYYHPYEDHKIKTLPQLLDIYYNSVGRNASLLINFPVDKRGLIHENDAQRIIELAEALKMDFAKDLAFNKKVNASETRENSKKYKAGNITDGNPKTYWTTDDEIVSASVTIDFGQPAEFNRILLQEYIPLGQRVKQFSVEAYINMEWKPIANQTTIGRKRILRFQNVTASKLRLTIEDAKASPVISNIEVYKAPKVLVAPEITRNKEGVITISNFDAGLDIFYTVNGNAPDAYSLKYTEPFDLQGKAEIKAIAVDSITGQKSEIAQKYFDKSAVKWKFKIRPGIEGNEVYAFDGDVNTSVKEKFDTSSIFEIDLGEILEIRGFSYLPDQERWNPGVIFNYEFYISLDGVNWGNPVSSGEFANIQNSPVWQKKMFEPVKGRFVKLKALSPAYENGYVGIAEFDIITR
ncbi:MAG TPA: alpha-L-fucosidase [Prolixibacteraceae bacterium]|nr:alpha-L-fucosidase [Prolixibacteraceae bacterium]